MFTQRPQLANHSKVYTGGKSYSCQMCASSFPHSSLLKLHTRMQARVRPNACKLCDKSFTQLSYLKKHVRCVQYIINMPEMAETLTTKPDDDAKNEVPDQSIVTQKKNSFSQSKP